MAVCGANFGKMLDGAAFNVDVFNITGVMPAAMAFFWLSLGGYFLALSRAISPVRSLFSKPAG
jgi:hypothetical protein